MEFSSGKKDIDLQMKHCSCVCEKSPSAIIYTIASTIK